MSICMMDKLIVVATMIKFEIGLSQVFVKADSLKESFQKYLLIGLANTDEFIHFKFYCFVT